jgi:glycosyltransferase involved in cell wall biosynthesis
MSQQPLVSIVVPVFNGGRFLRECLDSALTQSHAALELVVLDNASTDDTGDIAEHTARNDPRVRVFRNKSTLKPIENWNRAMTLMSDEARYCRVLHADDVLYPNSIAALVAVAETDPAIGIVGSLRQRGDHIECEGLPTDRQVFDGAEMARRFLRREIFALAPTSALLRADLIRARQPFYPPHLLHADLAAWLDILDEVKFGFVHEILAFSRVHEDSITATVAERKQTLMREWLVLLRDYGPCYFAPAELARLERDHLAQCHRLLVRGLATGSGRDFLQFHLEGLRQADRAPRALDYARAALTELREALRQPQKLIKYWHQPRLR